VEESATVEAGTQAELRLDLRALFQGAIRVVIEHALQEEVRELVGARRFERLGQRKDVRNGTYLRRLLTSLGQIDVTVPRTRASGSACDVLGRYQRRAPEVDDLIAEAYVQGVSTRKMGAVTEALLGERVGRTTVSRVSKRLEDEVEALRTAPIAGPIRYLYLDATFLDARWARAVENVAALVAYGVGPDGKRQLLGVTIGPEESEASWTELLEQLVARGLAGVELVIADEHAGLVKAVRRLLPEAKRQRCVVHLERNVLTKTPARLRGRVARQVAAVFQAPSKAEASTRLATFTTTLGAQVPEALACLTQGFEAATQFYAFPTAHWTRLRSTNGLERLHGEIKRRIRAVGAFPDRASALRLIVAVAGRVTTIWNDRRYLDMTAKRKEDAKQAA
jgi:transposase-like protein